MTRGPGVRSTPHVATGDLAVDLTAEADRLVYGPHSERSGAEFFWSLGLESPLPALSTAGVRWHVTLPPAGAHPLVAGDTRVASYVHLATLALERLGKPVPEELAALSTLLAFHGLAREVQR